MTELRAERQKLDEERRAAVEELATSRQSSDELDQAHQHIALLEFQLASSSQARSMQSASFLPRDAVRKRGLCCRPVSVRLSV